MSRPTNLLLFGGHGFFDLFGFLGLFGFLFTRLLVFVDRPGFFEIAKRRIGCAHDEEVAQQIIAFAFFVQNHGPSRGQIFFFKLNSDFL